MTRGGARGRARACPFLPLNTISTSDTPQSLVLPLFRSLDGVYSSTTEADWLPDCSDPCEPPASSAASPAVGFVWTRA